MATLTAPRPAGVGRGGIRLLAAGLVVTAAALTWTSLHRPNDTNPHFPIGQDVDRIVAAARAARVPLNAGEDLQAIDRRLAFYRRLAGPGDWMAWEATATLHLARAQLTGDYRDYAQASAAIDRAFAIAQPGSGPHLARAELNLAVHRVGAVAADVAAVRNYRIPGEIAPAALLGIEGEAAFYSGRPAAALRDYQLADQAGHTMSSALHLATYWSHMGDPARARRYFDQAESAIYGAQPAARSFVERSRGIEALRRGEWREAKARFAAANRLYPGLWLNLYYLAVAAAIDGDLAKARRIFESLATRSGSAEAMDGAAILCRLSGDRVGAELWAGRAEAVWQQRMRLFPEAAAAHRLDHLLAFGTPEQALDAARRAFAARPFAESRIGLAWALIANNRPRDALAVLAPVQRSGWNSAELHLAASRALALLGRGDAAEAEEQAALAINPRVGERNLPSFLVEH